MPLKENCEVCGAFMLKHNYKNGRFITYCSNEECTSRIDHPINKELEKNKKKTQEQAEKKENADVALDNSKKSGKTKTTQKKSTKKTSRKKAEEK